MECLIFPKWWENKISRKTCKYLNIFVHGIFVNISLSIKFVWLACKNCMDLNWAFFLWSNDNFLFWHNDDHDDFYYSEWHTISFRSLGERGLARPFPNVSSRWRLVYHGSTLHLRLLDSSSVSNSWDVWFIHRCVGQIASKSKLLLIFK